MKIVNNPEDFEQVISIKVAKEMVRKRINNSADNVLYVVKFEGKLVSFSTQYYKFAWKNITCLKSALNRKFGKNLAEALVENEVIEVLRIHV